MSFRHLYWLPGTWPLLMFQELSILCELRGGSGRLLLFEGKASAATQAVLSFELSCPQLNGQPPLFWNSQEKFTKETCVFLLSWASQIMWLVPLGPNKCRLIMLLFLKHKLAWSGCLHSVPNIFFASVGFLIWLTRLLEREISVSIVPIYYFWGSYNLPMCCIY